MYIFGGYEAEKGVYLNAMYKVDLGSVHSNNEVIVQEVEVKSSKKPAPRGNFSGCIIDSELYIFGGTNSDQVFDDMWHFNFSTN